MCGKPALAAFDAVLRVLSPRGGRLGVSSPVPVGCPSALARSRIGDLPGPAGTDLLDLRVAQGPYGLFRKAGEPGIGREVPDRRVQGLHGGSDEVRDRTGLRPEHKPGVCHAGARGKCPPLAGAVSMAASHRQPANVPHDPRIAVLVVHLLSLGRPRTGHPVPPTSQRLDTHLLVHATPWRRLLHDLREHWDHLPTEGPVSPLFLDLWRLWFGPTPRRPLGATI